MTADKNRVGIEKKRGKYGRKRRGEAVKQTGKRVETTADQTVFPGADVALIRSDTQYGKDERKQNRRSGQKNQPSSPIRHVRHSSLSDVLKSV